MSPEVTFVMDWSGEPPSPGEFLCSGPRAKVAYEITGVRPVKRRDPAAGPRYRITCMRWEPKEVPDHALVWEIRWHARKRSSRR